MGKITIIIMLLSVSGIILSLYKLTIGRKRATPAPRKTALLWPQPIHEWFGLSYASYLTLPRRILQEMPVEWQKEMVELLDEVEETFDWETPGISYYVTVRDKKVALLKTRWLSIGIQGYHLNERRPPPMALNKYRCYALDKRKDTTETIEAADQFRALLLYRGMHPELTVADTICVNDITLRLEVTGVGAESVDIKDKL